MFEFLLGHIRLGNSGVAFPRNKYLSDNILERDGVNLLYFQNKNILKGYQVNNLINMSKLYNTKILNHAAVITEIKIQAKIISENEENSYLACSLLTSSGKKREFPYRNPYELKSRLISDIMYPSCLMPTQYGIGGYKGAYLSGPYIYELRSGQTFYKNSLFMNPNALCIQKDLKKFKSVITTEYIDKHRTIVSDIKKSHSIDSTILPRIWDVAFYNRQRGDITEEDWLVFKEDYKKRLKESDEYLLELDDNSEL